MMKPFRPKRYQLLYNETARLRTLEILLRFPEKEFSLSDLAKEAGVAKANIGKILEELVKKGFIEIVKLNVTWRIKANQRNEDFITSKIVYNLSFIYQSGLVDFLNQYFGHPKSTILFGSFRKGDDISTSDIDIAIESIDTKEHKILSLPELSELEKAIDRKIQVHLFNRKNIDLNLFNNIANGIVLSGFLEVKP